VRSAGTQPEARIVVTEGHIGWADLVFVMEKSHLARLRRKFPEALAGKRVVTLGISDDYSFMQPELIDALQAGVTPHLGGRLLDSCDSVPGGGLPPRREAR